MTKAKPSFGKRNKSVHTRCRRCGEHSYHEKRGICANCGFGRASKQRTYNSQTRTALGKKKK